MKNQELVLMGIITSAHGVRGDVKVKSYTSPVAAICGYKLYDSSGEIIALKHKNTKGDMLVCSCDASKDRNSAESLRGIELFARNEDLPELAEDEFFIKDLEGMQVANNADNQIVGLVKAVHNFGAGDVLEIAFDGGGIVILPFAKEVFTKIEGGVIYYSEPSYLISNKEDENG